MKSVQFPAVSHLISVPPFPKSHPPGSKCSYIMSRAVDRHHYCLQKVGYFQNCHIFFSLHRLLSASINFIQGTRLRRLPALFERCSRLLVTTWGHDPSEIPLTGALTMLLDALQHSAILVQALCKTGESEAKTKTVAFPISAEDEGRECSSFFY